MPECWGTAKVWVRLGDGEWEYCGEEPGFSITIEHPLDHPEEFVEAVEEFLRERDA